MHIILLKVNTLNLEMMGYRDAQWYIKDNWIGFSTRNIAKQVVACPTFMASLCKINWI